MIPFILSEDNLSLYIKQKNYTINKQHPRFPVIVKNLKTMTEDEALELLDMRESYAEALGGDKFKVVFDNGNILINGEKLSTAVSDRYAFMVQNDMPIDGIERFVENLYQNPSAESRKDLYSFLEACDLPITEDGCFLAYKRVSNEFKDLHTHSIDNTPGVVVEMDRGKVNDDRNITCSTGLHVCSLAYLKDFDGDKTVCVKVNPRDVVSVPTDYHNAKMRVCRYEVIEEIGNSMIKPYAVPVIEKDLEIQEPKNKSEKKETQKSAKSSGNADPVAKFDRYLADRNLDTVEIMDKPVSEIFRTHAERKPIYRSVDRLFGSETAILEVHECRTITELKKYIWNRVHNKVS